MILLKYEKIKSSPFIPFLLYRKVQVHHKGGQLPRDKPAGGEPADQELPEGMRSPAAGYCGQENLPDPGGKIPLLQVRGAFCP